MKNFLKAFSILWTTVFILYFIYWQAVHHTFLFILFSITFGSVIYALEQDKKPTRIQKWIYGFGSEKITHLRWGDTTSGTTN